MNDGTNCLWAWEGERTERYWYLSLEYKATQLSHVKCKHKSHSVPVLNLMKNKKLFVFCFFFTALVIANIDHNWKFIPGHQLLHENQSGFLKSQVENLLPTVEKITLSIKVKKSKQAGIQHLAGKNRTVCYLLQFC